MSIEEHGTLIYIGGKWVAPHGQKLKEVVNPATEQCVGKICLGDEKDVDAAVEAARKAFESFSRTTRKERLDLLQTIADIYMRRLSDMADAIRTEMGAPVNLALNYQAPFGLKHFLIAIELLKDFPFEEDIGTTRIIYEPIGICGLITPWNWPMNQTADKVAPALAAGCTMVLKPSRFAPISAIVLTEILDEAAVPAGVFNMVQGEGTVVGAAISSHPGVDMVSFTGSTRAGIDVAKRSADTVKRVVQELGGKSANIILDDADIATVVARDVARCMMNSGQNCNAPTRMLVPKDRLAEVIAVAKAAAEALVVGDPASKKTNMGPVVSSRQWESVQSYIQKGIEEGASVVCGGPGRPEGLSSGFYVKPTVFANAHNGMTIAREEIFGPVLTIIPYEGDEEAVRIANDNPYGLSGYVSSGNPARAQEVAHGMRTGMVHINGASVDLNAPFGGYKLSGNGREWGRFGLEEFLEIKAVMGYNAD